MADERRRTQRRREERRQRPSEARDVTRLEHENLAAEVTKNALILRRVEQDVAALREAVGKMLVRPGWARGSAAPAAPGAPLGR
jgi:hypothetical protein